MICKTELLKNRNNAKPRRWLEEFFEIRGAKIKASEYVKKANIIFLSGGNTYIENEFFNQIHLKKLSQDFDAIIIDQSARSINMAKSVYNSPEEGNLFESIYFEELEVRQH